MPQTVTNAEAREALQACENSLADAFEASTDLDEKTAIFKTMRAIHREIVAAVQAELRDANGQYTSMTQDIGGAIGDLKKIQAKIDTIIVDTQRAAQVIAAIAKVLEIAAKVAAK